MCIHEHKSMSTCVWVPIETRRSVGYSRTGVTGRCNLPNGRKQILVLYQSSTCLSLLSDLSTLGTIPRVSEGTSDRKSVISSCV